MRLRRPALKSDVRLLAWIRARFGSGRSWWTGTGIAGTLALAVAVVLYQPRAKVIVWSPSGVATLSTADVLKKNFNPFGDKSDVILDLPTLAMLAANVYEPPDEYALSCSEGQQGRIRLDGWERLRGWSAPNACNAALSGLHYEVWSKFDRNEIGFQAVVFRGTLPTLAHWCSNLRNVTSTVCDPKSDQYLSIGPLIDEVLSGIYDEWGPDRYTVAVGHSLGGGLAELAGRSSYISQVFVFDSSPVVGTDMAALAERLSGTNDDQQLLRDFLARTDCAFHGNNLPNGRKLIVNALYEHGEVLQYPRLLKRWFGQATSDVEDQQLQRIEYRTNLLGGTPLAQHGMKALACAMRTASLKTPTLNDQNR